MKMRGYSVLFVCALCVFVLCGAAAVVVAQDEMPEKVIAKEARDIADMARERGDKALFFYKGFEVFLNTTVDELSWVVDEMSTSKGIADTLSLPGEVPLKEDIKEKIGKLQTATTEVRNALDALRAPGVHSLSNRGFTDRLKNIIIVVKSKVTEALQAAAAVTEEDISTVDAAIERAVELQAAAEAARELLYAAVRTLTTQMGMLCTVGTAVNTVKNQIENATKEFANNKSPETITLNEKLTGILRYTLAPMPDGITSLKTWLHIATNFAEDTQNKYRELAGKAEELKGKAEERRGSVQTRQFYNTHVYDLPNN